VPVLAAILIHNNAMQYMLDSQIAAFVRGNAEELVEMPVTINNRNLPRATAVEYAKNANHERDKMPGRLHLVWLPEGTPTTLDDPVAAPKPADRRRCVWQAPLEYNPDVGLNRWFGSFWGWVSGVVRIDAERKDENRDTNSGANASFWFGANSWVTSYLFRLRHPFSEPAEKVYWQKDDGSWVILISYITYRPAWTGTMIPVMGGVMEIGPYGGFSNHSPEEAKERFPGAALFPAKLGRMYAEAYGTYRYGLWDRFVTQKGLLEVSEQPTAKDEYPYENSYPYYQDFEGIGPQLIAPMEPAGPNTFALVKVLYFDAVSGQMRIYTPRDHEHLNGPRRALDNADEALPHLDWPKYDIVEPMLVRTNDKHTYYVVTVISKGQSRNAVTYIVINAKGLESLPFNDLADVHEYTRTGKVPARLQSQNNGPVGPAGN